MTNNAKDRSTGSSQAGILPALRAKIFARLGRYLVCATSAFVGTVAACAAQAAPTMSSVDGSVYARPGTLVKLPDGLRLNLRCSGNKAPTIILTAGAGEQSLTWRTLQAKLAEKNRVCAWDRPGFGFSDASSATMDVAHLTSSLAAALKAGMIKPPYILVGHSLGGFETLMLAFRRPQDVAGIVLIDPAGPFQDDRLKKAAPASYAVIAAIQTQQLNDLRRCIAAADQNAGVQPANCVDDPVKGYPDELNRVLIEMDRSVPGKRDFLSLLDSMFSDADARELAHRWRPLGRIPMIVLTAGDPPPFPMTGAVKSDIGAFTAEWSAMHDDMARLSTRGVNRRVPHATHYIYLDQPSVVLAAIDEVIAATHKDQTPHKTAF